MKLEEHVKKADEFLVEGKAEAALKILRDCLDTENAKTLDNPYLHLRKGQCHYILGEMEEAEREFVVAYTLDGERIFEDEDPRFRELLNRGS